MKLLSSIYLFVIGLCAFLHYPLATIYPYGMKTSVGMVFNFEFPHVFIASFLSVFFITLSFQKLNIKELSVKLISGGLIFILLSGLIFGVPFYKVIQSFSFFTVPIGVFFAIKRVGSKDVVIYMLGLLFLVNLLFCLLLPGNNKIGICGNQNWLAATLIGSFPFFIISLKKLPQRVFLGLAAVFVVLTLIVLVRTSARALIPAIGAFALFYVFQRRSWKVNSAILAGLGVIIIAVFTLKADKVIRGYNQDIRGPLAYSTFNLILSSPILGSGPGNFQRDIPEYASEALKKRIYYSSIIEHPHNEFLYMAANVGLPVAVIWLVFLYGLFKKRDDFEGLALQFAVLTVFVMGMADKPLQVSPAVIIFFIACGLLIPDKFWNEEKEERNQLTVIAGALGLMIVTFGVFRTQVDIRSRYHFWQAESLRVNLNRSNEKLIVPDMLEHYVKSSDIDPTFINAAYNAASVSLHFYNDLVRDEKLLQRMLGLEPDYSDFNLRIASFYMKQGRLLKKGKKRSEIEAEAEKHFIKNFELSPWNINRCRSVIRFYEEVGNESKVEEWILKVRNITWERLKTRYTHTDKTDLNGDINSWLAEVGLGKAEPFILAGAMKAKEGLDYSRENLFQRTNTLQSYSSRNIAGLDRKFFTRRIKLLNLQLSKGIKDTQSILNFMASCQVSKEGISWPLTVFEKGSGSARSLAYLACALNKGLGNESALLVNDKGVELCILFEGKKCWIWNCKDSVLVETTPNAFHTSRELRSQLCGQEEDDFYYELFCYPEAFCLRNQLVADVLVSFSESLKICNSPALDRLRLRKKVGAREIRYANKHIRLLDAAVMNSN